jgi:cbb3-type cytochrome c oxidase subunit III
MRRAAARLTVLAVLLAAAGCGNKGSAQLMAQEPRYEPLEDAPDLHGAARRMPVPGTVARGHLPTDDLLATGMVDGRESERFPFPVTREVLERGRERFDIFCSPCHGRAGDGRGIVVRRGFTAPPSFHTDTLRGYPAGHFFRVMTQGFGAMPQYAKQVPVRDRWAIAAYIRALQLSQHARAADLPADVRARLERPAATSGARP